METSAQAGRSFSARAWFVGKRIDTRSFELGETLALSPLTVRTGERGVAVVFRYGAVVLFDVEAVEQQAFLRALAPLVSERFDEPETEDADITVDPEAAERVDSSGEVLLRDAGAPRLQVVADVLAKSAVLSHYEDRVADVLARIEPLAARLQQGGRAISARAILREIGDVLLTEANMVGRVEVPEKPENIWDHPELDRLYVRLRDEYELRDRDLVLSRKLDLVSRTANTLLELLQSRRSLHVEWYIAILIVVEIAILIYDLFLRH